MGQRESKFQPEVVFAYLQHKEWPFRIKGENYLVQTCTYCGNPKWNLEIQRDRGYFKCWACGETGSFWEFRKHQGDLAFTVSSAYEEPTISDEQRATLSGRAQYCHEKLFGRDVVLQYVRGRGFNDAAIKHFKLGARYVHETHWLVIPHLVGGDCVNLKYRTIPPAKKEWQQEEDSEKVLFNQDSIEGADEIILCEGELKAIAIWQAGFERVVSITGGVEKFRPAWVDILGPVKKIYMLMDNDDAGRLAAEKIAMRLGPERCYNVSLPEQYKDADEYFLAGHTKEEFKHLLTLAKKMDVRNVMTLNAAFGRLIETVRSEDEDTANGIQTPWKNVNKLTKGFRGGQLIILSAPPKIGKTTWALNLTYHVVKERGPALFFCMEMGPDILAKKLACLIKNKSESELFGEQFAEFDPEKDKDPQKFKEQNQSKRAEIELELQDARYRALKLPLVLADHVFKSDLKEVIDTLRAAYRRYGLKMIVFDNLHFLCRTTEKMSETVAVAGQAFKLLATELGIPIILIVHPRKLNHKGPMTSDDLKDTSSLHADADVVVVLHRKRIDRKKDTGLNGKADEQEHSIEIVEEEAGIIGNDEEDKGIFSPFCHVIIDASRFSQGGRTTLFYDGAKSLFRYCTQEDINDFGKN